MDTNITPDGRLTTPGSQPGLSDRIRHSKALLPTLAVMAVAVAALATTLVVTRSGAQDGAPATHAPAVVEAPRMAKPQADRDVVSSQARPAPRAAAQPQQAPAAAGSPALKPANSMAAAPACAHCGTVESVVAVQRQGPVQGIGGTGVTAGHVAGGVIGGLLGNQVGGGSGRTAATVLGAAGGAYAGGEIQKNMHKYTAYQVRVRMDDGSYQTIEQRASVAAGSRVTVDKGRLRSLPAQG